MSTATQTAETMNPTMPETTAQDAVPPEISVQNPEGYPEVEERELAAWLRRLVADLAPRAASFTARFIDDTAMRDLNQRYRNKDRTTDVLSFPGGETPEGRHLGDVVISLPAARRQAPEGAPGGEIRRLLLHGVLHCLGYDHETDDGEMEALETRLRREWV